MLKLTAALLLVVMAPLAAQQPGADSAAPTGQGYAPGGTPAPTPSAAEHADASVLAGAMVLPRRSEAELQRAIGATQDDLRRADARLSWATETSSRAKGLAQQRRVELREIEAKRKQADKEKRKADKALLEAEKRAGERQKQSAEQLEKLGDAEVEAAREQRQVAVAKHQALELELQLAQKRSARATGPRSQPGASDGSDAVIRELEQQTLQAQSRYRKLDHELAQSEEQLADSRLDLYRGTGEVR